MRIKWEKDYLVMVGTSYAERHIPQSIIGAVWDKKRKLWLIPKAKYEFVKHYPMTQEDRQKAEKDYQTITAKWDLVKEKREQFFKGDMIKQDGFLMRHQKLGLDISSVMDKYCFFYDTGTGKTIMALSIIDSKPNTKWCVVCPIVLVLNAWMEDAEHFPSVKCLPLTSNITKRKYIELCEKYGVTHSKLDRKETLIEKLKQVCNVFIINPESFHKFNEVVDGLIFDESVLLKNPSAKITKQIMGFSEYLKYIYLLSGEPAPNNEEEFFSQIAIVDPGLFGKTVTRFRDAFFRNLDRMGYKRELRPERAEEFFDAINKVSTFVTKEQCLDLPEHTTRIYKFQLSPPMYSKYKELEKTAILEMQDIMGQEVQLHADLILTKMMKARQFTGGFIINEDAVQFIHNEKLETLKGILETIGNKQVIIWVSFHPEVKMISSLLDKMGKSYVTAYGLTKDKDLSIQEFINGNADVIIAHPKTLKYGVTFTNCAYSIKYSMGHSYDDFKQSQDRIHRKGKTVPTTEYLIAAEGTIDQDIINVAMGKRDKSEFVRDLLNSKGGIYEAF